MDLIHSRLFVHILAGLLPYGLHIRVQCKLDLSEIQRSITSSLLFVIKIFTKLVQKHHKPQPDRNSTHYDLLLLGVLL